MKTKWNLDTMHSEVQFRVKHLVIATVTGTFGKFSVEAETEEEDFSTAEIIFSADINSVNTGNEQRDAHLKSADFFDAANYPQLFFRSASLKKNGEHSYKMKGDLTLRGITKTVEFDVEFGGKMKDPYGNMKAGFEVSGKIKRKEFGLHWDAVTETGGVVVSDEVKINANVEMVKVVSAEKELIA